MMANRILANKDVLEAWEWRFPLAVNQVLRTYGLLNLAEIWRYVISRDVEEIGVHEDDSLFVSVSKITPPFHVDEMTESKFTSKQELIDSICESCALPFILTKSGWFCDSYKGEWVVDGGAVNNNPVTVFRKKGIKQDPILCLDGNKIEGLTWWENILGIIFPDFMMCERFLRHGMRDTLTLLREQKEQVGGVKYLARPSLKMKKLHSTSVLPEFFISPKARKSQIHFKDRQENRKDWDL